MTAPDAPDCADAPDARPAPRPRAPGSPWKVAAVLAAVFALGGVAGGSLGRMLAMREIATAFRGPPGEARAHFRLEAMRRHLGLSDEQVEGLDRVLTEAEQERERHIQPCRGGLDALRTKTDERIRALLTPEQRARYAERERRRPRGRPDGPSPRPHGPPPH